MQFVTTVDSRYNEPRREMKISSLYREFVKSKMEKNREFYANINSYLRVVKLYIFSQLANQKIIKMFFTFELK